MHPTQRLFTLLYTVGERKEALVLLEELLAKKKLKVLTNVENSLKSSTFLLWKSWVFSVFFYKSLRVEKNFKVLQSGVGILKYERKLTSRSCFFLHFFTSPPSPTPSVHASLILGIYK